MESDTATPSRAGSAGTYAPGCTDDRPYKVRPSLGLTRGGYILAEARGGPPEVILIGTGSEVALCLEAYEQLAKEGVRARVVSMPSWELFDDQDKTYRDFVLPPDVQARVSVEEGIRLWLEQIHRFAGPQCLYRELWGLGAA